MLLVGGYTFYNTHWPNDTSASSSIGNVGGGGGQVVSNINELGGEKLLRRRLSDSTAHGKFITYIIVYIIL